MTVSNWGGRYGWLRWLLHWAKAVFTPLSLLVIAFFIWQSRATLGATLIAGTWDRLLVAVLLWMAGNLLAPLVSVHIFKIFDIKLDYLAAVHIHCSRLPAKYLPGGIWHSVGRANDYFSLGHNSSTVGIYFIVENILLLAVTIGMSAGIVAPLVTVPVLQLLLAWLPLLMVMALLAFPFVVGILWRNQRPFSISSYFISIVLLLGYWSLLGCIFAYYISAFDGLQLTGTLIETAGIYVFSWSMGYIALFAPQGIGVAEFISGSLLGEGRAAELLAFLIGFRLLVLVADLLSWSIAAISKIWR